MTTIHYVVYNDDFHIVNAKAICGHEVNRVLGITDYCVTLWYFLHEVSEERRCQKCYEAIGPLELLANTEL